MFTKKIIVSLLSCIAACHAIAQDSLLLRNYRYVKQSSPWLIQPNAAALSDYSAHNMAVAELSINYSNGRFSTFGGEQNVLQVGAGIESYYRIGNKTVVFGSIEYENWTGRDMTGSVFLSKRLPFDIVEASLENEGEKHRDTYNLAGAIGFDFYRGYSIGARLNYTAANYAKYKDLRHKNKLMDLSFLPGLYAPITPWLQAGVNYNYYRQTESVAFNTYGKSDKVYKSFIDYGAMMGMVEQFGNEGYTDNSREMPYFEDGHGCGIQVQVQPCRSLSLYADASISHATGYYGNRSPYTIAYTNHNRDVLSLHGRVSLQHDGYEHHVDVNYGSEKLQNSAETFRTFINDMGSPNYEYYDAVETSDKHWYDFSADYTLHLDVRGELPTWTLHTGFRCHKRDVASYLYPYYRRQVLSSRELTAAVERHIVMHRGVWTLAAGGGFQWGSGDPYVDGTFVTPSEKQETAATMDAFMWQDFHLFTAPQYYLNFGLKYAFRFPGTRLLTHVRGTFDYRKANNIKNEYCGRDRTSASVAIGCTF